MPSEELFTMENLYLAYRKAKVDVYYERSQPMAEAFCAYENSLDDNLKKLAAKLTSKKPTWPNDLKFIGGFGFIPKGLKALQPASESVGEAHFSLSDPEDAWKHLLKQCKDDKPSVEFRPVAHFTVNMYVVCALWVNLVGHKYDACLTDSARGSRLRRLRGSEQGEKLVAPYHKEAPGSFQPYFYCYREWRERGLKAIRNELSEGRRVVALTMDLTGFYHNVDPRFLLHPDFLKSSRFQSINGALPTANERGLTEHLITAFETWAAQLPHLENDGPPGVPVGPSAPRVIANVLLGEFDRLMLKQLVPIYYGRYVDDIFLVLRDTGAFSTAGRVISHLARRIRPLKLNKDRTELRLELPYAGKSKLLFKTEKQRVFVLSGEIGEDLLDTIESKIDEVSSEWRLLPNLDDLERSPAARVLTAARNSHEDADSLRKADELSLRRFGFSLMLRSVNALARDLPPDEWVADRKRFYRFANRHVLTPLRLLDLNDYLPRLVSLAVACEDWSEARNIVARIAKVLRNIRENVVVKPKTAAENQWDGYTRHLRRALLEAVACSYPLNGATMRTLGSERLIDVIDALSPNIIDAFTPTCETRARNLFWSDFGRAPFKDFLLKYTTAPTTDRVFDTSVLPPTRKEKADIINRFLSQLHLQLPTIVPLLFPTRSLNAPELTECLPELIQNLGLLSEYFQALRGTWVRAVSTGENHAAEDDVIEIGVVGSQKRADRRD